MPDVLISACKSEKLVCLAMQGYVEHNGKKADIDNCNNYKEVSFNFEGMLKKTQKSIFRGRDVTFHSIPYRNLVSSYHLHVLYPKFFYSKMLFSHKNLLFMQSFADAQR